MLNGEWGEFRVTMSVQRIERTILNSSLEPVDFIVSHERSLEDVTFRAKKSEKKEEERRKYKGTQTSSRTKEAKKERHVRWEDLENAPADLVAAVRGRDVESSSRKKNHSRTQVEKREKKSRHGRVHC